MISRFKTYGFLSSSQPVVMVPETYTIRETNLLVSWLVRLLKHFHILNIYVKYVTEYKEFEINFDNVIKAIFENQQVVDEIAHKKVNI